MAKRGLFITFEGGDGAGKTTQVELLRAWLTTLGREVLVTREPGGTSLGAEIRQLLLHSKHDIAPRAEALLYAADRAQHIAQKVLPALTAGTVVVQDRYIDSSLAYQGAGRVLDVAEVRQISEWATAGLWPDLTVLLDLDVKNAESRQASRGETKDRLESEAAEFHEAVRAGFLSLAEAEPHRYLVVDASLPVAEISQQVISRVSQLLG